jgi:acetyl/propionyl-CoA carboxylase alpha subunit
MGPPSNLSYLKCQILLLLLKLQMQMQFIRYGFLSENSKFSKFVRTSEFIGASPEMIDGIKLRLIDYD